MKGIYNHNGELFYLKINESFVNHIGNRFTLCLKAQLTITANTDKIVTKLDLLSIEELNLLKYWLDNIYKNEYVKPIFKFADKHIWFKIWNKFNKPILRFFIRIDEKTKYYWDWDILNDNNMKLLAYINRIIICNQN